MSRNNTKNYKNMRRSALSFTAADGSLDIDHVLQSNPWKDVEKFEKSETTSIQNVLNDFDNKITQEKAIRVKGTTTKKKASPRSTKKSPIKSPKDSSTDLPGTSSSTNSNDVETKITVNRKKRASITPRKTSKRAEETISQKLLNNNDNVKKETQNISKASIKENVDLKKIIKQGILQNITNISENNLHTSTPKKEKPKIIKKTSKKKESTSENKKSKPKNSENKSERDVQQKKRQRISKKNTKNKQGDSSGNILKEEREINVKSDNNSECNNVNKNSSKNKVENKKTKCCGALSSKIEKKYEVKEINNNMEKSVIPKKCTKNIPNESKKKNLKKENCESKLRKSVQSCKSPPPSRINNMGNNTKCQCKKNSANCCDNKCSSRSNEHIETRREREKNVKAAKAIDDLSHRISAVKRKMESIKNDLESNESLDFNSSFNNSSYSLQSSTSIEESFSNSDSYSCCSTCSYDCTCSHCEDSFYSSDISDSNESSGNSESNE